MHRVRAGFLVFLVCMLLVNGPALADEKNTDGVFLDFCFFNSIEEIEERSIGFIFEETFNGSIIGKCTVLEYEASLVVSLRTVITAV